MSTSPDSLSAAHAWPARHPLNKTAAAVLLGLGVLGSPHAFAQSTVLRIDTGSAVSYTDTAGNVWQPDRYYLQGRGAANATSQAIRNAQGRERMYQSERWEADGYNIPLPNGTYTVRLHMAEINPASGRRVFNISAESQPWLTNYSIADKVGNYTAAVESKTITISDGMLNLAFRTVSNATSIAGIEIVSVDTPPPTSQAVLRVDTGATANYTDASGSVWQSDRYYVQGRGSTNSTSQPIANAQGKEKLYQSERWEADGYNIPLPSGTYTVRLHMAEINPASGRRVFNISAEGQAWLTNYSIADKVGNYAAVVESKSITVNDGMLNLAFKTISNATSVAGIEIFSNGTAPPPPPPPPPPSGKWISGASGDGVPNGSFGSWRGTPVGLAVTWSTTTTNQRACTEETENSWQFNPGFEYDKWSGSADWSMGGICPDHTSNWAPAARGDYDQMWIKALQNVRADWYRVNRGTLYIRFAHEMNGNWYPWSVPQSQIENFKTAWRRFRAIQKSIFPEAKLVFNTNGQTSGQSYDWRQLWPGDSEVDVYSTDFYQDHYQIAKSMKIDRFGGPIDLELHRQFAQQHGKPFAIPEWGGKADVGDDPAYISYMHDFAKKNGGTGAGNLLYEAYFNVTGHGNNNFGIYPWTRIPNESARYRDLF